MRASGEAHVPENGAAMVHWRSESAPESPVKRRRRRRPQALMVPNLVRVLSDLIATPSVNPMGQSVSGPEYLEYRVTDYLENLFRELGVRYQRQTVEPQRDNIIARLDGRFRPSRAPVLLFDAHQDTVPVTGMTIEPWTPVVREDRIYGRGACDIKGGLAAMLVAFARLAAEPPSHRPTLIFSATVNEEHGFSAARRHLPGCGNNPIQSFRGAPRRPSSPSPPS